MTQVNTQILQILSPVHIPTVSEWMDAAKIYCNETKLPPQAISSTQIMLMQRWEQLVKQPLTKNMFIEEIFLYTYDTKATLEQMEERKKAAQQKVIFEGFENYSDTEVVNADRSLRIDILPREAFITFHGRNPFYDKQVTVLDFIIEVTRYNRTATTKIEIQFTSNFAKLLSNG